MAAGLNSIGILTGGGLGRVIAQWILDGRPDVDVTAMNIDRLHAVPDQPRVPGDPDGRGRSGRCTQSHYPDRSMRTARGAKRSPLHDRLAAAGARFRDVSGWEGADWYGPPATTPEHAADLGAAGLVRALGRRAPGRPRRA